MKKILLLVIISAISITILNKIGLCINMTKSLDQVVYLRTDQPAEVGDIVGFCLNGELAEFAKSRGYTTNGACENDTRPLMKYLAALGGDKVGIMNNS